MSATFHGLLVPYSSTLFQCCMPSSSLIPLIDYNLCNNITSKSWIHQCSQSLYPRFETSTIQRTEARGSKTALGTTVETLACVLSGNRLDTYIGEGVRLRTCIQQPVSGYNYFNVV